jgi:xylan 1,4-beta-xylosidase
MSTSWCRGLEGQRRPDLGDGRFLNPILPGDHPDPTILKDGDEYYLTVSSFESYPGLVIWHSRDLVNWRAVGPALHQNVGAVWAPELAKHEGRYYIYFPGRAERHSNYVVWADDISGPWSAPIDLRIGRIDPGHIVDDAGQRYLFLSDGYMVPLQPDGLAVAGEPRKVYDGWRYPDDWIVETFALEAPKLLRRGGYYYLLSAQGGTAGPPTSHMIVAARARSLQGPWENSPYNPIVRTRCASERWWSKGHGSLIEDPAGGWWLVYHAYENGFRTLGRQTLLEPVEWTSDGWFRCAASSAEAPLAKPTRSSPFGGVPRSDDFANDRMGIQWQFHQGDQRDAERTSRAGGALVLESRGISPRDSHPMTFVVGDHAYEVSVEMEVSADATGGLLLFYSSRLYAGLGFRRGTFILHNAGEEVEHAAPERVGERLSIRLRNDRHIVTMQFSEDGERWRRYDRVLEVSGYHHNVAYDFLSLRPALYAAGHGAVRFANFTYRALP